MTAPDRGRRDAVSALGDALRHARNVHIRARKDHIDQRNLIAAHPASRHKIDRLVAAQGRLVDEASAFGQKLIETPKNSPPGGHGRAFWRRRVEPAGYDISIDAFAEGSDRLIYA